MKKFINNVDDFLKESLNGFGKAHSDIIKVNFEPNFVSRKTKTKEGKVSLISGGGSGHEPMHGGFVGHGMLDAACPGFVFSAPTPDQMQAAAEHVDSGAGVPVSYTHLRAHETLMNLVCRLLLEKKK